MIGVPEGNGTCVGSGVGVGQGVGEQLDKSVAFHNADVGNGLLAHTSTDTAGGIEMVSKFPQQPV
jgi:hypothetical protein